MIKIVIIDKHDSERNRASAILASHDDFEIVGLGKDAFEALTLVETRTPHIVILDIHLDIMDGIKITPLLKSRFPSTAIIFLTALADEEYICTAVRYGVQGYILKDAEPEILASAVRRIHRGERFISPRVRDKAYQIFSALLKNRDTPKKRSAVQPNPAKIAGDASVLRKISSIELQIMVCIGYGYSTKEIAERFGLANGTVRNYLSSGMQKAGLQHRTQIPLFAVQNGLISLENRF